MKGYCRSISARRPKSARSVRHWAGESGQRREMASPLIPLRGSVQGVLQSHRIARRLRGEIGERMGNLEDSTILPSSLHGEADTVRTVLL